MSKKVAELTTLLKGEDDASWIVSLWDTYYNQLATKRKEWTELRNYLFATDTSTTSNSTLPWKNSTTLSKLTQIRDNLHSNYFSALFPNDDWLRWEGYGHEDAVKKKAASIQAFMKNKTRESNFRTVISRLLYDFIDYGNAFAMPIYEERFKEDSKGNAVPSYLGPNALRISPLDIVFNPLADSFDKTFKIVRSVKTLGEIAELAQAEPDNTGWAETVARRKELRKRKGEFSREDFEKSVAFSSDGFGNLAEYFTSDTVEILEFYGDFYNAETDTLEKDMVITVVDRSFIARRTKIPGWMGGVPIYHVGWRLRPDNLWAMGPLDNLVGMQYRIDHLENLKADAQDLTIHPPLKIYGGVEQFTWGPGAEIHIDEGGDVVPINNNLGSVIGASNEISVLENRMEQYAGAPREAMGIRTPGEKTAFEIQTLQNAAGRIFQEKITMFEIEMLERLLNSMLEIAVRNFSTSQLIKIFDEDAAVTSFLTVTREDITATGVLRPIGARHFAAQAQLLQNLIGVFNSPIGGQLAPHTSAKGLAKLIDNTLGIEQFKIFVPNIAIFEQAETKQLMDRAAEEIQMQNATGLEG